jgi:hypothetical protein
VLKQMEDLKEETGLTCCICREGYRYQPNKVCRIQVISIPQFSNEECCEGVFVCFFSCSSIKSIEAVWSALRGIKIGACQFFGVLK